MSPSSAMTHTPLPLPPVRRSRRRGALSVSSLRHHLRHSLRISQCSAFCSSLLLFFYSLLLFLVSVPVAASVVPHPPIPSPSASSDDSSLSLHSPIPTLLPCYGVYELKGRRHYMEDTHAVYGDGQLYVSRLAAASPFALEARTTIPDGQQAAAQKRSSAEETKAVVEVSDSRPDWLLFGIFDGHGGADASAYTAVHLLPLIHSKLTAYQQSLQATPAVALPPPSFPSLPPPPYLLPTSSNLSHVFQSSFQHVDDAYLHHPLAHHRHHSHADGSTAIVIGVERRSSGERIVVANAGDCRALLVGEDSGEGKEVVAAVNPAWQWMSRLSNRLCTRSNDSDSDSGSDDERGCKDEEEEEDDEELLDESKTADITEAELLHMYHHFHPPDLSTVDAADLPAPHSAHYHSPPPAFLPLSVDHKPHLPLERAYIQSQPAGFITTSRLHSISRVQGVLATSRAIGDYELKPYVRCEPDVVLWEHEGEEGLEETVERMKGRWLVLGSDGFFDAWSSAAVSGWVREMGGRGMGVQAMAKELVKSAYKRGSDDNITVMIIDLQCLYALFNASSRDASTSST